ncbi:MAG: replicative DNA helicase, partial [Rhodospirillales bacterium]
MANALMETDDAVDDGRLLRTPPHNFEAEQALLGAILGNQRAYERVSEFLRPEHFADPVHGRIYDACGRLIERGQIANPITLAPYLENDEIMREVGGQRYLAKLVASMVTIVNAEDYARQVYDLHIRRELIDLGEGMVNEAYLPKIDEPAMNQIEAAEQKLFNLAASGESERGFVSFHDAATKAVEMAEAAYKRDGHLSGISTGLRDVDNKLGGLHPSDLLILAARPAMGKTSWATNVAFYAAQARRNAIDRGEEGPDLDGGVVAFFSLEMSADQLATRIMAEATGVSGDRFRRGDIDDDDFDRLTQAMTVLSQIPLFIDDTPALSVSALRTRSRRLQRIHGLDLIVVDYLQLMRASPGTRVENRVQEVSEITRGLKALAKELSVPVIALSQLSRQVENRDDKRPQLSDLRESGSI